MSRKNRAKKRRASRQRSIARNRSPRRATLAVAVTGDDPPTEFRIFVAGWNDSENGRVLFDDKAAAAVMAAFEKHGVDRMIDLEHLSLDQESNAFDPDARGWARLELRGGELWAVDVKWTDDGANRIRSKRQRFISPTFFFDDDKRVTKVLNIALTALPATHDIAPLVAARAPTGDISVDNIQSNNLSGEQAAAALEAVKNQDGDAALAIVEALLTAGMMPEGEEPPAEEPPAEDLADDDEPDHSADEDKMHNAESTAEVAAATARLLRLTNRTTLGEALEQVDEMRSSHVQLEAKQAKLAEERAALELGERKALSVKLTKLGAETPATTGLAKGQLVKRLLEEPLESLRARVKALSAAKGGDEIRGEGDDAARPPATGKNPHGLTDSELRACKLEGCEPATFAALKAQGKAS
jgi:phage I-like protein